MFSMLLTQMLLATLSFPKNNCSQVMLQTNPPVNLTEYMRASWYIQQQQVNGYQKIEDLYCVTADYKLNYSKNVPFYKNQVILIMDCP